MEDDKHRTPAIRDILNDVDLAVAADRTAIEEKRKRAIVITIACVAIVVALIGYISNKHIEERQFRDGLLETAILVTSEYGVEDLTIVSVSHSYPNVVIFQSDTFTDLSDKDKMEVFREFNKLTGTYSWSLDCEDEGRVVIVSDETRYTAKINEYGSSYYRYLYADGDEILKDTYTNPSTSSKSSGSKSSGTKCSTCNGTGKVVKSYGKSWLKSHPELKYGSKCPHCGGTGYR